MDEDAGMRSALALSVMLLGCVTSAPSSGNDVPGGGDDTSSVDSQLASVTEIEVGCDVEYTRTVSKAGAATTVGTYWYAETAVPSTVSEAWTKSCDRQTFGAPLTETCGAGETCTGTSLAPPGDCSLQGFVEQVGGKLRTFCGTRNARIDPDTGAVLFENGYRFGSVTFRFR